MGRPEPGYTLKKRNKTYKNETKSKRNLTKRNKTITMFFKLRYNIKNNVLTAHGLFLLHINNKDYIVQSLVNKIKREIVK